MKAKFLIFSIFLSHVCWAQIKPRDINSPKADILYWYQLRYLPDSSMTTERSEMMRLYTGRNFSKFISNGNFLFDSLEAAATAPGILFDGTEYSKKIVALTQNTPIAFRFQIYKDFSHNLIYYYERVWATDYQYEEAFPKWNLTSTTSIVAGYPCQLATTLYAGRTYQAWFTRSIPVADGPYKFSGLPGLIIKIADSRRQYTFELVGIKRLAAALPIAFSKKAAKQTTRKALQNAREDLKKICQICLPPERKT